MLGPSDGRDLMLVLSGVLIGIVGLALFLLWLAKNGI